MREVLIKRCLLRLEIHHSSPSALNLRQSFDGSEPRPPTAGVSFSNFIAASMISVRLLNSEPDTAIRLLGMRSFTHIHSGRSMSGWVTAQARFEESAAEFASTSASLWLRFQRLRDREFWPKSSLRLCLKTIHNVCLRCIGMFVNPVADLQPIAVRGAWLGFLRWLS